MTLINDNKDNLVEHHKLNCKYLLGGSPERINGSIKGNKNLFVQQPTQDRLRIYLTYTLRIFIVELLTWKKYFHVYDCYK